MLGILDMSAEEQSPDQVKLYETCLKGSREEIRRYCDQDDLATQYIKDGMNPMHIVAIAGRPDAAEILGIMLDNGFDVNVQTRSGEDTVLHLIVEHIEVKEAFPLVLKILDYEPDLRIRNRRLRTPYDIALARGEIELAAVLDGSMTAEQAKEFYFDKIAHLYGGKLVDAVLRSNESEIQEFIRLGADPNHVNKHKNGAIHYAVTHCQLPTQRTLQMLIDGKADVNLQDDEGDTALNLVIKSTRLRETGDMYKCAELLHNNGALSTFKDLDGNDALALAKKRQYEDIVILLTKARPRHEQEALILAVRQGTLEDINDALFNMRADPNIPDDAGLYPIHHVLIRREFTNEEERMDALRSLIEAGADINSQSVNSDSTPLHVAATKNQDDAAKLLLDTHKCDYNLRNKAGKTAYEVAEEEECYETRAVIENHRKAIRAKMQKATKKASVCTIL